MNVFELFKESYGVGVVASKKQAKDPRYSHSLTVDVKPDTPKKNQKALGLTEATAKEKAAWLAQVQPYAEHAAKMLNTNPEFILDQWALESGYKIPKNNNLGGLTKRGEESGFREYDSLEDYTQDWLAQINKNFPEVEGAETMDDYVDALQNKGRLGAYAREEGDKTYRERLAGMQTGYVPSEEAPTVAATPKADDQTDRKAELQKIIDDSKDRLGGVATQAGRDAYLELQKIEKAERQAQSERDDADQTARSKQNAIATLQKEFQDAMERGDGKAMNDIMASVRGLGGSQAAQQVAQGTFEPTTVSVTPADDRDTKDTIDKLRQDSRDFSKSDEERSKAQAELRQERDELDKQIEELRKDPDRNQAELNRLARKRNEEFGEPQVDMTPIGSSAEEGYRKGKEVRRDDIISPADLDLLGADIKQQAQAAKERGEERLAKEIEAKAEQVLDQAEKAREAGIQYIDTGGEEPAPIEKQVDLALDKMRKAQPDQQTDSGFKVSPESEKAKLDRETAEADRKKREAERKVDMSKAGQAKADDPFFQYGDAEKPKVSTTPKPEPEKVEPEEIKFEPTKQRQHYRDKYSALTPAFMMDEPDKQAVIARERLKRKAGELMRTNPAEWNKLYGGDKLGKAIEKAEQDAYAKFDAPTVATQPKPQAAKAKVPAVPTSEPKSAIGKVVSGNQTYAGGRAGPGSAASTKTLQQVQQERQAKLDQQKAEQEAKKAEQQAKAEAQKAEQERKRQEQKAEQEAKKAEQEAMRKAADANRKRFQTRGAPVPVTGESAIFKSISRK